MSDTSGTSIDTGAGSAPAGVRFSRDRAAAVWTLDRPAKLNAINSGMKAAVANEIPKIARDPQVYAVILRAAPCRMFSAGGDIREIYDMALTDPATAVAECAREYSLIWLIDCFSKPTIALIDGPVLGTGVGIVQSGTHRAAGAGYRFQMPETLIGYFPDNGVCRRLAHLPHEIGTWLGLTGEAIGRADALWLDLITHCIGGESFDAITGLIADAQPIDRVLGEYHVDPGDAPIKTLSPVIERCFSANSVIEIIERLRSEKQSREFCDNTIGTLLARSPLALEVTLRHLRRCRHLDLRQTLTVDHRLAARLVTSHDFLEGVRARLIEKQGEPRWQPSALTDISRGQVDDLFEPLGAGELVLPTIQEMQALRV